MDEETWESGRPISRVSSQANLSLFDEEILFDDDPNRAYFNYMVGIDNQDDSLLGIHSLEEMRERNQPSKRIQQRWMHMAESSKGTLDYSYPGPNTIEESSLPITIEDGSLPSTLVSAVPRDDMEKAIMKRFPGAVNVPNVIFCAPGTKDSPAKNNRKEMKQEKLTAPGAPDCHPRPHHSFMWQNKRKVILGLSLLLLGVAILVVALVSTGDLGGSKGASSSVQGQVPSAPPSTIPTSAPLQEAVPADSTLTAAPSAESPTISVLPDLITVLSDLWPDGSSALSDSGSPQFRAAQWLSEEPDFGSYSDRQIVQRYVLATLFFATKGDQWTNSDGWLTTENECNWYTTNDGICTGDAFQILDLESNNLQGQLPSELALLADTLERFDLARNNLEGSIPTVFGLLTGLEALNFKFNLKLGGSIPSELGLLTQLTALSLGNCSISSNLPTELGSLTDLDSLGLELNQLVGQIPTQFGLMRNLRNLALNVNQLTGTVPPKIFQLKGVEKVALESNNLSGTIPFAACANFVIVQADCDKVACSCCANC